MEKLSVIQRNFLLVIAALWFLGLGVYCFFSKAMFDLTNPLASIIVWASAGANLTLSYLAVITLYRLNKKEK